MNWLSQPPAVTLPPITELQMTHLSPQHRHLQTLRDGYRPPGTRVRRLGVPLDVVPRPASCREKERGGELERKRGGERERERERDVVWCGVVVVKRCRVYI